MSFSTIDQIGNSLLFNSTPQRVISLVPSITELLHYLIPSERVVGITKFCIKPNHWFRTKTRIGGTKNIHIDTIEKLNPDLIIANKEENEKEQITKLSSLYPVWISDIKTMQDTYDVINELGKILDTEKKAKQLSNEIEDSFKKLIPLKSKLKIAYFIWDKPKMVVGNNNFINHLLEKCGFENAFSNLNRYPQVTTEEIIQAKPDIILLSSEPYPFSQKHQQEFERNLPASKVYLVDGELFSWYGPRLLESVAYFNKLIKQIEYDFSQTRSLFSA